ncbi:MAG: hypothetical protein H6774_04080 [Pseudomonadales bacterium]|nr:hypothetical protein [Candidatus Woesebacteria bacterium]MCB9802239.1 hypothetical protein [Pseudomonadales bacterium]
MKKNQSENQTTFTNDPDVLSVEQAATDDGATSTKWYKKKRVLIGIGVAVAALLFSTVALTNRKPSAPLVQPSIEPSPSVAAFTPEENEYERRIRQLQAELEAADPADEYLPFPAVSMELSLE